MEQRSFFGLSEHLERLSQIGDPLEALEATIDFEYFRGWLVEGLGYSDVPLITARSRGARCLGPDRLGRVQSLQG